MTFLQLLWSFFQVGLLSFGGGMAALPLIQAQVVETHGWLTLTEFTDLITIAEMTPGPIAINAATFVGTRIAGVGGALIATLGCILPSCILVSLLAWLYFRYQNLTAIQGVLSGLRPAVVAMIVSAGLSIFVLCLWGETGFSLDIRALNYVSAILFVAAFFVLRKWKPSPIFVMLGAGVLGGGVYLLLEHYGIVL